MPPASIRCCWPSAASATSPTPSERRPQELLTCANAILGQGQLSLAKYLLIVAREDDPDLDIHDIPAFFRHLLERVDWRTRPALPDAARRSTRSTIRGTGLNEGSKVVIAAAGPRTARAADASCPRTCALPDGLPRAARLPAGRPGRAGAAYPRRTAMPPDVQRFCAAFAPATRSTPSR